MSAVEIEPSELDQVDKNGWLPPIATAVEIGGMLSQRLGQLHGPSRFNNFLRSHLSNATQSVTQSVSQSVTYTNTQRGPCSCFCPEFTRGLREIAASPKREPAAAAANPLKALLHVAAGSLFCRALGKVEEFDPQIVALLSLLSPLFTSTVDNRALHQMTGQRHSSASSKQECKLGNDQLQQDLCRQVWNPSWK